VSCRGPSLGTPNDKHSLSVTLRFGVSEKPSVGGTAAMNFRMSLARALTNSGSDYSSNTRKLRQGPRSG